MEAGDIIAVSAVVIAFASLVTAFQSARLVRRHNRLSVRPFIEIYRKQFKKKPIEYSIENRGIGPAIIKKFSVLVDNNEIVITNENSFYEVMDLLEIDHEDLGGHLIGNNEVIKPSQEVVVMQFSKSGEKESLHTELLNKLSRIKFKIQYKSMYEEQYEYEGNG